jgi:hypothetical protein
LKQSCKQQHLAKAPLPNLAHDHHLPQLQQLLLLPPQPLLLVDRSRYCQ